MTKKNKKTGLWLGLLALSLSSCANLKHVNEFSSESLKSLNQFEDIDYSFKQNCLDSCEHAMIYNLDLDPDACNCELDQAADEATLKIYNTLNGYLDGLTKLSDNELTNYKTDELANALKEGNFGSIVIKKDQVDAYSNISKILLRAITDKYRARKIKEYVMQADASVKVLLDFLDHNLSVNLVGKLNVQKERLKSHYFDLIKDASLSKIEQRKSVQEYYQELAKIEIKKQQLLTYCKTLKKISEGHQKLAQQVDKLTKKELKAELIQYASDIRDIISELNKLKK